VEGIDDYWRMKASGETRPEPAYEPVEMPRNSPTGFITAFFAVVMGFALIWHIWWMVMLGAAGAFATFMAFAWRDRDDYEVPPDDLARMERDRARSAA
jgi:cytochrome o ubiquinol oxidase subunit 1